MKNLCLAGLFGIAFLIAPAAAGTFAGRWSTTFGDLTIDVASGTAHGTYVIDGKLGHLEGRVEGDALAFAYREPDEYGEGRFRLASDGSSFEGEWRPHESSAWNPWKGHRPGTPGHTDSFTGLWETTFGRMRLIDRDGNVSGIYAYNSGANITGTVRGKVFNFRFHEPKSSGAGSFTLNEDGRSFRGRWKPEGAAKWGDWEGRRVDPLSGQKWLIVVEARWEDALAEREYSFGEMLKSFFARTPQVQVRQRFFSDAAGLTKAIREAAFLAEPTVLLISSHGEPEGISVDDSIIGPQAVADALRLAPNIKLLHIDACDVMSGAFPAKLIRRLGDAATFPISGYTESVDWAASAISDFMYLDLILSRDFSPADAARELPRLIPYAGAPTHAGAPFATVGFRLLEPPSR